jgi:hypothetical protein
MHERIWALLHKATLGGVRVAYTDDTVGVSDRQMDKRSLSYTGDILPLVHGVNVVRLFVNGIEADHVPRFIMK